MRLRKRKENRTMNSLLKDFKIIRTSLNEYHIYSGKNLFLDLMSSPLTKRVLFSLGRNSVLASDYHIFDESYLVIGRVGKKSFVRKVWRDETEGSYKRTNYSRVVEKTMNMFNNKFEGIGEEKSRAPKRRNNKGLKEEEVKKTVRFVRKSNPFRDLKEERVKSVFVKDDLTRDIKEEVFRKTEPQVAKENMKAEVISSSTPGFCYLRLVKKEFRQEIGKTLGKFPFVKDLKGIKEEAFIFNSFLNNSMKIKDNCIHISQLGMGSYIDLKDKDFMRIGGFRSQKLMEEESVEIEKSTEEVIVFRNEEIKREKCHLYKTKSFEKRFECFERCLYLSLLSKEGYINSKDLKSERVLSGGG
jgi:hypothetical protein